MSINLSPHEKKILSLVEKHPTIVSDPVERKRVAELNGMSEKTLRNRLADLKRYGVIGDKSQSQKVTVPETEILQGNVLLFWNSKKFITKNTIIVTGVASVSYTHLTLPTKA